MEDIQKFRHAVLERNQSLVGAADYQRLAEAAEQERYHAVAESNAVPTERAKLLHEDVVAKQQAYAQRRNAAVREVWNLEAQLNADKLSLGLISISWDKTRILSIALSILLRNLPVDSCGIVLSRTRVGIACSSPTSPSKRMVCKASRSHPLGNFISSLVCRDLRSPSLRSDSAPVVSSIAMSPSIAFPFLSTGELLPPLLLHEQRVTQTVKKYCGLCSLT